MQIIIKKGNKILLAKKKDYWEQRENDINYHDLVVGSNPVMGVFNHLKDYWYCNEGPINKTELNIIKKIDWL